jgi:hypothetical protein
MLSCLDQLLRATASYWRQQNHANHHCWQPAGLDTYQQVKGTVDMKLSRGSTSEHWQGRGLAAPRPPKSCAQDVTAKISSKAAPQGQTAADDKVQRSASAAAVTCSLEQQHRRQPCSCGAVHRLNSIKIEQSITCDQPCGPRQAHGCTSVERPAAGGCVARCY